MWSLQCNKSFLCSNYSGKVQQLLHLHENIEVQLQTLYQFFTELDARLLQVSFDFTEGEMCLMYGMQSPRTELAHFWWDEEKRSKLLTHLKQMEEGMMVFQILSDSGREQATLETLQMAAATGLEGNPLDTIPLLVDDHGRTGIRVIQRILKRITAATTDQGITVHLKIQRILQVNHKIPLSSLLEWNNGGKTLIDYLTDLTSYGNLDEMMENDIVQIALTQFTHEAKN
ncbi:hypothetical protein BDN71DRAFT_1429941 [Pleurotus eryngii]|uniref:Uncharacterized protein n=1 Tax=Pleurotus eryngii TaxID=5323 RepID=A0A9P6DH57_PLEER|nr:hypothetical protein BDN71DRAFT_1429941 [Pleurotus eryngii]